MNFGGECGEDDIKTYFSDEFPFNNRQIAEPPLSHCLQVIEFSINAILKRVSESMMDYD